MEKFDYWSLVYFFLLQQNALPYSCHTGTILHVHSVYLFLAWCRHATLIFVYVIRKAKFEAQNETHDERADDREAELERLHVELLLEEVLKGFQLEKEDRDLVGVLLHCPRKRRDLGRLAILEKFFPVYQKTEIWNDAKMMVGT